jgi:hypothetical protein
MDSRLSAAASDGRQEPWGAFPGPHCGRPGNAGGNRVDCPIAVATEGGA